MTDYVEQKQSRISDVFPDMPLVVWMMIITVLIGITSGMGSKELVSVYNSGWGHAIGEFALILLPSFVLAAALEKQRIEMSPQVSVGLAPLAGAGMVCPDTAYAAISPMVRKHKLPLAFGAYSGFKLLFPAGPLLVATSLGVGDAKLLGFCLLMFIPVWVAGLLYGYIVESRYLASGKLTDLNTFKMSLNVLWPFLLLATLLTLGVVADMSFNVWLDFATNPKGALFITAVSALSMVVRDSRRSCIDSGLRRTGSLLLIIGAASAFSAILTSVVPINDMFSTQSGLFTLISLFVLTAIFKLLQGSSMSTFAAAGPVAVPIVAAAEVSPVLAVVAICLGSFVAILPNDSYYWLVKQDTMAAESDFKATAILAGGSTIQAVVGMSVLILVATLGIF